MSPRAEVSPGDRIPLLDLHAQHRAIRDEVLASVVAVADSQRFIHGEAVGRFEQAFGRFIGVRHAIGVSSGTDALLMILMALEVEPLDEIITTPFSFIATTDVIRRVGARPRFGDIASDTLMLRPQAARALLSSRTRAILPAHLYGRVCDLPALGALANEHGVPLIEDCAQSLGAKLDGKMAGSFGLAAAFSFFPSKNLGGWGDGGMVTTGDDEFAEKLRQLRDHGQQARDRYVRVGGNFRLDTLQAAVLEVKLRHLPRWLEQRKEAAATYSHLFVERGLAAGPDQTRHQGHRVFLPAQGGEGQHAFNLYVIQAERRDELRAFCAERGVDTGVYYPVPLHLQPCFEDLGLAEGDLPTAEAAAKSVLALPLYPEIEPAQLTRVVDTISDFYKERRRQTP